MLLESTPALADPPGVLPGQTYHIVYVTGATHGLTSSTIVPPPFYPRFGGLEAADYIVTDWAAGAAGSIFASQSQGPPPLGIAPCAWIGAAPDAADPWDGVALAWTALLSTNTVNMNARATILGPVYNTAGELLATGRADFFDGTLEHAIGYDQYGQPVSGEVWTGSFNNGAKTTFSCSNWTSNSSGLGGTVGTATISNGPFQTGSPNCNKSEHLYALSPPIVAVQPGDYDGDFDVDGADFLAWQRGESPDPTSADDLAAWQDLFGAVPPPASAVPEPTSAALALLALAWVLRATAGLPGSAQRVHGRPHPTSLLRATGGLPSSGTEDPIHTAGRAGSGTRKSLAGTGLISCGVT